MNVYALFPLIATIAYIPLIATVAGTRPWQRRHTLFILFLASAIMWSFTDVLFRSSYLTQHRLLLGSVLVCMFSFMAVQFHVFTSSFFTPGHGRWLPFAYLALATTIALAVVGYIPGGVVTTGDHQYPDYGAGMLFMAIPLLILAGRNVYVFRKMLRILDNPVMYSQIFSLMLGIFVLAVFGLSTMLPFVSEYPLSHFGNLINAVILSYAVIRHRLVDIRIVIRQGTAWLTLAAVGLVTYWLLLVVLHSIFNFELNLTASFVATGTGLLVAVFVYRLRGFLFALMSRAFQGPSYEHRQKLSDFISRIHNVFNLKDQGSELLTLITRAIDIKYACLLFPETGRQDFSVQLVEPKGRENEFSKLKLKADNPIVKYLERERRPLSREDLAILPEFLGLWSKEKEDIESREIEMIMPLISRDRLIAILMLGKKQTSRYSLEDFNSLENVTKRVAVSMEKEYLREQLREREMELSVINNSSAIITSSFDIQEIYGSFIEELKKVVDVSWSAIVLVDESGLRCVAVSSVEGSAYQVGEKLPMQGTGTGWVVTHKKSLVETDLSKEMKFATGQNFHEQGMRSMVYLPLISKGKAIGSLILASRQTNAYSQQHLMLLEQLASQIAIPLENARLYAKAEEEARIDELTGLLNRRSLDEMIDTEINRHSRYGGVFSLAILDLDSFKTFNDTRGHLAGDNLLGQVGYIIRNAIRSTDQAFRYGGDEFAILLPHTNVEDAIQVTERVRESIASDLDTGDIKVTASIGLAIWPEDGISHTDIIATADLILYRAKWSGGNRSYCASGTMSLLYFDEPDLNIEGSRNSETVNIIHSLAETVDTRSNQTRNHSKKVTEYALAMGKSLDMDASSLRKLEICALLHDIGKIGISDDILNKPGELVAEEWEIVKGHPQLGANIVAHVPQLAACAVGIRHHHEWYDGSGYPDGLKGDEIPMESRILNIADAFTAMTSERAYSSTLSFASALEEIKRGSGKQFDPYLVGKFLSIYEKNLIGTRKNNKRLNEVGPTP
jgi:diguanylate cyclase (GGDEF)-like protein